jgi:hypothetical protein
MCFTAFISSRMRIVHFLMFSIFFCAPTYSAELANVLGVYDTETNRFAITFDIDPIPTGVDSFYFDFDGFPVPSVFDPSTAILFSTIPGAVIDQFFGQESIWIDFPSVVTTPLTYTAVFQVVDVSDAGQPLDVDIYLNPNFGNNPSALPEWAFPDIPSPFSPGEISIPEPSSALLAVSIFALLASRRSRR